MITIVLIYNSISKCAGIYVKISYTLMSTWEALKRILKTYQKTTLASSDDKHKKMQLSEATIHKAYQKLIIQKLCWKHKVLISAVIVVSSEEHSLLLMIEIHHQSGKFKLENHHSTTALSSRIMTLVLLYNLWPDMDESFFTRME
jgi:hypothetical protein